MVFALSMLSLLTTGVGAGVGPAGAVGLTGATGDCVDKVIYLLHERQATVFREPGALVLRVLPQASPREQYEDQFEANAALLRYIGEAQRSPGTSTFKQPVVTLHAHLYCTSARSGPWISWR